MAVTVFLALVPVLAPAQSVETKIRDIYAKIEKCMGRQDCESVIKMLAPDYRYVDPDGKSHDREEAANQMRSMMKSVRNAKGSFNIKEIYVNGPEATVWVTMRGTMEVKNGGKWSKMDFSIRFIETLSNVTGKWLFTESYELR